VFAYMHLLTVVFWRVANMVFLLRLGIDCCCR